MRNSVSKRISRKNKRKIIMALTVNGLTYIDTPRIEKEWISNESFHNFVVPVISVDHSNKQSRWKLNIGVPTAKLDEFRKKIETGQVIEIRAGQIVMDKQDEGKSGFVSIRVTYDPRYIRI